MSVEIITDKIDQFHMALGKFVEAWAAAEYCIDNLILLTAPDHLSNLVLFEDDADVAKLPYQFTAKIKRIRSRLYPTLEPLQRDKLAHAIDRLQELQEKRNDYVHGAAIERYFSQSEMAIKMGRLLQPSKREPVRVTAADIEAAAKAVADLGDSLFRTLMIIREGP
ncbi:hypothetical protein [Oricola indica]|uniref:hypothetical protein n=1 Tax=Oricola indica TaxID=2872591 RepID=UPI001CBDBDF5|nr:hypothetical protein [Oricola indica]